MCAISYREQINLAHIDGKMDSQYYTNVLCESLIPTADALLGEDWVFQRDNAAVPSSTHTKTFLEANDVHVLDWPAKSPDINIIENVWGLMVRRVYDKGSQCNNITDLQDGIMESWKV